MRADQFNYFPMDFVSWAFDHDGPRVAARAHLSKFLADDEALVDGAAPREARDRLLGPLAAGVLFFAFSACALVLMYLAWTQRREQASLRAQARKYAPHVRRHPRGREMMLHLYDAE
jgi:hypothetical protein